MSSVNPALLQEQPVVADVIQLAPLSVGGQDAARLLGISERLLSNLTTSGEIPSFKAGERRLYRVVTLKKWVRQQEQAGGNSKNGS